jgi:hypothetical protein
MLSLAALSQPCSSRFAAALASSLRPTFRPFSSSRQVRQEKAAQPQTPATEHVELRAVSRSLRCAALVPGYNVVETDQYAARDIYLGVA